MVPLYLSVYLPFTFWSPLDCDYRTISLVEPFVACTPTLRDEMYTSGVSPVLRFDRAHEASLMERWCYTRRIDEDETEKSSDRLRLESIKV